ncbi:hypothetical protein [Occallatibacter savannae]|uniref:hypothetical protein n=1 Tax=Occallatibacter savannae TaxID=1002691 RepID=UPI0013A59C64|nr:hypothetical protein [Occallatibacter savannae]
MNGLREVPIEGTNARERDLDEPVFTGFFHELGDSIGTIDFHHHKQTLRSGNTNDLAELGKPTERLVGLNDDSGYGGTHWTPQQVSDFRRK